MLCITAVEVVVHVTDHWLPLAQTRPWQSGSARRVYNYPEINAPTTSPFIYLHVDRRAFDYTNSVSWWNILREVIYMFIYMSFWTSKELQYGRKGIHWWYLVNLVVSGHYLGQLWRGHPPALFLLRIPQRVLLDPIQLSLPLSLSLPLKQLPELISEKITWHKKKQPLCSYTEPLIGSGGIYCSLRNWDMHKKKKRKEKKRDSQAVCQ